MASRLSWKASRPFTETSDYVNLGPSRDFLGTGSLSSSRSHRDGPTLNSHVVPSQICPTKPKMPVQRFFLPTSSFLRDDTETPLAAGPSKRPLEPDLNGSRFTEEATGKAKRVQELFNPVSSSEQPSKKRRIKPNKPEHQNFKRILIGSVEHVIRWHKTAKDANLSFLFETVGILDNWSVQGCAQLLFLRGDLGQIIQGLFYTVDHGLPPFKSGCVYSFVGKMIGSHKMIVFDAKEIDPEEKSAVQRLAFLCQRQLNSAAGINT